MGHANKVAELVMCTFWFLGYATLVFRDSTSNYVEQGSKATEPDQCWCRFRVVEPLLNSF